MTQQNISFVSPHCHHMHRGSFIWPYLTSDINSAHNGVWHYTFHTLWLMSRQGANRYPFHNFSLWKPRNERNYASNKKSRLKGKRSAAPLKRPTVMKELISFFPFRATRWNILTWWRWKAWNLQPWRCKHDAMSESHSFDCCHLSVKNSMCDHEPGISHHFDIWHLAKGLYANIFRYETILTRLDK